MRTIALLTDFGLSDSYAGAMKGAILTISSNVNLVDLTHNADSHNIEKASFLLLSSYRYFPKKTIFVAVVDPGVGSKRKAVALKTRNYYFVGPDNGILSLAACDDGIKRIVSLDNKKYFSETISGTFHGRDIFASVAAYISKNVKITSLGGTLRQMKTLHFSVPQIKDNMLIGQIIHIDKFGNLVTNIKKKYFLKFIKKGRFIAHLKGKSIRNIYNFYEESDIENPFFIEGSSSFLEISLKRRNARKYFKSRTKDKIIIRRIF